MNAAEKKLTKEGYQFSGVYSHNSEEAGHKIKSSLEGHWAKVTWFCTPK